MRVLDKCLGKICVSNLCWQTCEILARIKLGGRLVKTTYLTDGDIELQRGSRCLSSSCICLVVELRQEYWSPIPDPVLLSDHH